MGQHLGLGPLIIQRLGRHSNGCQPSWLGEDDELMLLEYPVLPPLPPPPPDLPLWPLLEDDDGYTASVQHGACVR